MNRKLIKFSLVCVTGAMVLTANPMTALAMTYEEPVAGFTYDKTSTDTQSGSGEVSIMSLFSDDIPVPGFDNIGIANVETNLMVRSGPGEDKKILGKLPKNGGCDILEADTGSGWTKIKSGSVTGYVKTSYLITGSKASKLALEVGNFVAISNTNDNLNVRKAPLITSDIVDSIAKGEELLVADSLVVTYGEEHNKWVKVYLDSDIKGGAFGYVSKEYVNLSYSLATAVSMDELDFGGKGVSSLRANLVNFAKQFLGDSYVWGGTTLGKGVDCSGFTMQVYHEYGYNIPRVSGSQGYGGTKISSSQLKPGDLVFYGSSGSISHVAIYIGNQRIIHASNRRDGIKISNMYYRTPVRYERYIND